jgi:hypothetical protein
MKTCGYLPFLTRHSFTATHQLHHSSYGILVQFGKTLLPLLVDTGSADVWAISDACPKNCSRGLPAIPHKTLNYSGVDARLFYGDSSSQLIPFESQTLYLTSKFT